MRAGQRVRGRAGHGFAARARSAAARFRWRWLVALLAVYVVAELVLSFSLDERLRRSTEAAMNAALKGYTVRLPYLDFDILGLTITLRDLSVVQKAHPQPPVAQIRQIQASVQWRALIHRRVVGDMTFDAPRIHVDLKQLQSEAKDPTPVEDKGWQQAIEAIYPLKINHFEVHDGTVTYVDADKRRPLKLERVNLVAENVRNVRSPELTYPSTIHYSGIIFEKGRIRVDGHADFMAEPYAGVDADVVISGVPLGALEPVAGHANLRVTNGVLGAEGHVEYAPKKKDVHLRKASIDKVKFDYVHTETTAAAEDRRVEKVKEKAAEVSNEPTINVQVDEFAVRDSELGYTSGDQYRVFISNARITLRDLSNQAKAKPASVEAHGRFMGDGVASLQSTFRPVNKTPEFDLVLKIEKTPLKSLNPVFKTYANFDVAEGSFSFYSELKARDGQLTGYMKPLFTDMNVYERSQDKGKPFFNQLYQTIIGGIASLLQNSRDDVATKADVSGRIDQPNVSTWQVVLRLIQNAFFRAILPGFEREVRGAEP